MKLVAFFFREGSSVVFAGLIAAFAYFQSQSGPTQNGLEGGAVWLRQDHVGMFVVAAVSIGYLALQMAMAAFARVGQDRPMVDVFFSFVPLIALIVVAVLVFANSLVLSAFSVLALAIAGAVVLMDIVFNSQILFKINRLANDFVQMR